MIKYKCTSVVMFTTLKQEMHQNKTWHCIEDLPDDWVCPDCGVGKDMFEKM